MEDDSDPAPAEAVRPRFAAIFSTALLGALLLCNADCSTPGAPNRADPQPDRPAVLVSPTAAVRAELARAVREALHGAPVRLADDALTRDSHLIIERVERRDAAGLPLNGRSLEKPMQFQLLVHDGRCILVHASTGRRWPLPQATCTPIEGR